MVCLCPKVPADQAAASWSFFPFILSVYPIKPERRPSVNRVLLQHPVLMVLQWDQVAKTLELSSGGQVSCRRSGRAARAVSTLKSHVR